MLAGLQKNMFESCCSGKGKVPNISSVRTTASDREGGVRGMNTYYVTGCFWGQLFRIVFLIIPCVFLNIPCVFLNIACVFLIIPCG